MCIIFMCRRGVKCEVESGFLTNSPYAVACIVAENDYRTLL